MGLFNRRLKDYRFSEMINEKGKRTMVLEYTGNYFYYKDSERAMRAKPFAIAYGVVMIACWILALSFRISALRLGYVSIPYVASVIGVFLYCRGAFVVMVKKEPFIRPDGDSINYKFGLGAGICVLLVLVSFVGTIVSLIGGVDELWWTGWDTNNIIFLGICLVFMGSSYMAFRLRKDVDLMEKFREQEKKEEAKKADAGKPAAAEEKTTGNEDAEKKAEQEQKIAAEIREKNTAKDASFTEYREEEN